MVAHRNPCTVSRHSLASSSSSSSSSPSPGSPSFSLSTYQHVPPRNVSFPFYSVSLSSSNVPPPSSSFHHQPGGDQLVANKRNSSCCSRCFHFLSLLPSLPSYVDYNGIGTGLNLTSLRPPLTLFRVLRPSCHPWTAVGSLRSVREDIISIWSDADD